MLFRKISGSPLRFFGLISSLLFLITAGWRWSGGVFQGYNWYSNLAPLGFVFACVSLYTIAFKTNDLSFKRTFLSRLVGSPLKFMAFILILWGTFILTILIGYIHYESQFIWIISGGISLYLIELFYSKDKIGKRKYWAIQLIAMIIVGLICLLAFLKSTAKTDFIISNNDEFIVVYEMDGYPPLPKSFFWRKTIQIPKNGLLITSSSVLDLPGYRKNYFDENNKLIQMYREYNSEYCPDNKSTMSVDYYATKMFTYHIPCGQSDLQIAFQNLFDSMCKGEIKSNFVDTTLQKNRHSSRDIWCEEYKKNIESSLIE